MSTITFTESKIARVFPADLDQAYNVTLLSSDMTAGHAIYQDPTTGAYGLAVTTSGYQRFRGILLETAVASGVVSMLQRGILDGFDLSGMNYDDPIYLGDVAGTLQDAAGVIELIVGRVVCLTDPDKTKVAFIDAEWASAEVG